jgi:hypothetical protein
MPKFETIAEWLDRAKAMYEERETLINEHRAGGSIRRGAFRVDICGPDDLVNPCSWFVDIQFLGLRPSEIATRLQEARSGRYIGGRSCTA